MNRDEIQAFFLQVTDWTVKAVPNLIAAILIMAIGWFTARTVSRLIVQVLGGRTHIDQTLTPVIATFARYAILIITVIAVLGQMGVQIASVLAVLGAAGLAIGLALQGTLSNIAAGMMLLWLRPFRVGDAILADGMTGKVEEIGLFATTMRTFEGVYRFVPNSALWNKPILNYARNPSRRIEVVVRVDRALDEGTARQVLLRTAAADERVMKAPAPEVVVAAFNDVSVDLALHAWVPTADFGATNSHLAERARAAIRAAERAAQIPGDGNDDASRSMDTSVAGSTQ